ncbi:MAG: hypothetical protein JO102_01960, partial [Elusimicrobia bacterium]|nr:hypothetical protein [Elusimicrobiota bacterium]
MRVLSRTLTFVALSLSTAAYAGTPAFLILADGAPITQRAHDFEASGVVVRQRVPPRVMIVEVPSGMNPATLPGVMSAFTAAVPISSLESIGPSAVAAGVHWNRRVIIDGAAPAGGFAAARQMAADRSLPSPADFRLSPLDDRVAAEWSSVDGAPFYELEASIDPMFRSTYLRTMTGATRVEFAGPGDAGLVYVRVRAGDPRPDGILWGSWTNVVNQAAPSAPAAGAAPP